MSKIEVDAIEPQSGTSLTLGASGDTLTIPSGATLVNNGTASGFGDNLEWQSSIVTASTITVTANKGYWIDTTSNACTITLPAAAAVGDRLIFTDYARNWATNAVTINQNSLNFQGNSSPNPVYDTTGESIDIVYSGATKGWIPNSDGEVALETSQGYDIDFLVLAGGGAGGCGQAADIHGGGGGGGGYRTSTQSSSIGVAITVTVGTGGPGNALAPNGVGGPGTDSSISGTGLTTITSTGGGGGGAFDNNPGLDGGSGGGGVNLNGVPGPGSLVGSGDTPSTTPSQGNDGGQGSNSGTPSQRAGGGGGGAGSIGGAGPGSGPGGTGGSGTASTITGPSVTYAGGGGGGGYLSGGTATGGGGAGGANSDGSAATDGLGGGGGGGGHTGSGPNRGGGDGGNGVVILSVLDADYSGTTTGSPTVATGVSGKTVLTFTGSGSYTT